MADNYKAVLEEYTEKLRGAFRHRDFEALQRELRPFLEGKKGNASFQPILEFAVRLAVDEYLREPLIDSEGVDFGKVLDVTLWLTLEGFVEPMVAIYVLEDLFESQTIDQCERLFDLVESRLSSLQSVQRILVSAKRMRLMTRCFNILLRRLSKTDKLAFCGRIHVFMSNVYTLSADTVSSTKGADTGVELSLCAGGEDMAIDQEDQEAPELDHSFYEMFWGLQSFLNSRDSAKCLKADAWPSFAKNIGDVLNAFSSSMSQIGPSPPTAVEREKVPPPSSKDASPVIGVCPFNFPRFLMSPRLLRYQFKDVVFVRHIITQILALLHFVEHPVRVSQGHLPTARQKHAIADLRQKALRILEMTVPDGKGYADVVMQTLEREEHWVTWKYDILKQADSRRAPSSQAQTASTPSNRVPRLDLPAFTAHQEMIELAIYNSDILENNSKVLPPSMAELAKDVSQLAKSGDITKNEVYEWKLRRLCSKQNYPLFTQRPSFEVMLESPDPDLKAAGSRQDNVESGGVDHAGVEQQAQSATSDVATVRGHRSEKTSSAGQLPRNSGSPENNSAKLEAMDSAKEGSVETISGRERELRDELQRRNAAKDKPRAEEKRRVEDRAVEGSSPPDRERKRARIDRSKDLEDRARGSGRKEHRKTSKKRPVDI